MNQTQPHDGQSLASLLAGYQPVCATDDVPIRDLTLDSRAVQPGSCFFALSGTRENGLRHARDAVARGAVAIVAEDATDRPNDVGVPLLEVPGVAGALGDLANRFYDHPSLAVRLFAVTGTNGKTTVAHLLAQALQSLEGQCGYIGTLGIGRPGDLSPSPNTTPDVITVNRLLAALRAAKVTNCALEVSSHALAQRRIDGLSLEVAMFTNLSHDHLDYHANMRDYAAAKQRLFDDAAPAVAVVNVDDALGSTIAARWPSASPLWTCSSAQPPVVLEGRDGLAAENIQVFATGITFDLRYGQQLHPIESKLVGRFNVDNLLLVAAALLAVDYDISSVIAILNQLNPVAGRMEFCGTNAAGAKVFVDYAHTPDGLIAALSALREFEPAQLHVVFGCGGDRDQTKRPLMGAAAARFADRITITSDNPRYEDPHDITAQIIAGIPAHRSVESCLDRAAAIQTAVAQANFNDIVLVAGKGHETVQESGDTRVAFDDRDVVMSALGGIHQ